MLIARIAAVKIIEEQARFLFFPVLQQRFDFIEIIEQLPGQRGRRGEPGRRASSLPSAPTFQPHPPSSVAQAGKPALPLATRYSFLVTAIGAPPSRALA